MGFFDTAANFATLGAYDALDLSGDKATGNALNAQQNATTAANNTLTAGFDQQQSLLNPWADSGRSALETLSGGNVLSNFQGDPGYQFRLNEGNKAINASMAARGMGNSGAALKALQRYGQDYASNEYNNAYNREFNRLNTLAGYGSNATNQLVNAAGNWASGTSNNLTGLGNAQASANIAQSNRMSNMIGQGISAAAMFSDERVKKNIKPIPKEDLEEMKSILKSYYFEYVSNGYGLGSWAGVMAQDLEKSKIGKMLVVERNGIKTIDQNKVLSMFLATMAEAA